MTDLRERVATEDAGKRLDVFWQERLVDEEIPRARLQCWIRDGRARVNGRVCRKPAAKLVPGQWATLVPEPPVSGVEPQAGFLDVVFADDEILVVNKEAGLTVHPAPSVDEQTLVHRVAHAYPRLLEQGGQRPGIVHRLDKDTSGLLVLALTDSARQKLSRAFASRCVCKEYLAVVAGVPPDTGEVALPLGRHPSIKTRMAVVPGGRPALTEYHVVWSAPERDASLVRVRIHTGRTHQIRVHMAAVGHPLLGDSVYADPVTAGRAPRQMLHAWRLEFAHPHTGAPLSFLVPPPRDFFDMAETLCRRAWRVGLTGVAGSGKSALRRIVEEQGVPVFCADDAVARAYAPGGDGWTILRHHFGDRFVPDVRQPVDKDALYRAIQDSDTLRRDVEALVHPVVRQALADFQAAHAGGLTLAEIPLLLESGLNEEIDMVVAVFCADGRRRARLARRGWDEDRIARMDGWQWPQSAKVRMAALVVDNSGSERELARRGAALAGLLRNMLEKRVGQCTRRLASFFTTATFDQDR